MTPKITKLPIQKNKMKYKIIVEDEKDGVSFELPDSYVERIKEVNEFCGMEFKGIEIKAILRTIVKSLDMVLKFNPKGEKK